MVDAIGTVQRFCLSLIITRADREEPQVTDNRYIHVLVNECSISSVMACCAKGAVSSY